MSDTLTDFPLKGVAVCEAIQAASGPEEMWVIELIETLSDGDGWLLGDIWRQSLVENVIISARDLCAALIAASQVITFDAHLAGDENIVIYIEDGKLVENFLPAHRRAPGSGEWPSQ